jgi:hypothetical protein
LGLWRAIQPTALPSRLQPLPLPGSSSPRAVEDRALALLHVGSSLVSSLHIGNGFSPAAVGASVIVLLWFACRHHHHQRDTLQRQQQSLSARQLLLTQTPRDIAGKQGGARFSLIACRGGQREAGDEGSST